MRHNKSFNHLGRKSAHRKAMLSNMVASLIMHKRIETTTAKAKALRKVIEPMITRSKEDSTHARRVIFSYLQDKEAVTELFREVAVKVGDRPGGYTRIIKMGHRLGDNADMCLIELVDYNENLLAEKAASKKATSRRRRGSKPKAATGTPAALAVEEPAAEAVAEEVAVSEEEPVATVAVEEPAAEAVEEEVAVSEEEAATEEPVADDEPEEETKE